jgi:hypothetical protein
MILMRIPDGQKPQVYELDGIETQHHSEKGKFTLKPMESRAWRYLPKYSDPPRRNDWWTEGWAAIGRTEHECTRIINWEKQHKTGELSWQA